MIKFQACRLSQYPVVPYYNRGINNEIYITMRNYNGYTNLSLQLYLVNEYGRL